MKKIITAMSMVIVLTSSNTMAQEEFGLGSISDFFSEMRNSIEEGVTSYKLGEEALRNIATNYQTIKSLLFQSR